MLKINLLCVGKIKEKFYKEAIAEYQKRIGRFAEFKIIEIDEANDKLPTDKIIEKESADLLSKIKGSFIAMDIGGKEMSSEAIALLIADYMTKGMSEITFVIGGSNGFNDIVRKEAKEKLSFGKITYPHQLMRVVLCEQIYRILTINNNIAYHK